VLTALVALTFLLTAADHWTTYVCLRTPVPGWEVTEANPISDWLFQNMGVGPGLLLDSAVTIVAMAFLLTTRLVPPPAKTGFFFLVSAFTAIAVANNSRAILAMGISPLPGL